MVVEKTAPAEAGIKKARARKEDDNNARNSDRNILDENQVLMVFPSCEARSV
jgi:hypothetical protein